MTDKAPFVSICMSADGLKNCLFPYGCYGIICISPRLCSKKVSELTPEERKSIEEQWKKDGEQPWWPKPIKLGKKPPKKSKKMHGGTRGGNDAKTS